ncbi:SGNH/GDSL hydrolase family protein [Aquibium oceanicum]|uniref:Uncharacterized protein n=1 Tax=Aquibium oceanicum TaxID=1670800 RepID=A0A1L3SPS2_9HYPH|nr:hypothetical protein [Aquibium oceanicum]APH71409.1 hypothetical protein BSQ44_08540 [Aquibium oceanicum]
MLKGFKAIDEKLRKSVKESGGSYFSTLNAMCIGGDCVVATPKDFPVQFDYGHFLFEGGRIVLSKLKEAGLFTAIEAENDS